MHRIHASPQKLTQSINEIDINHESTHSSLVSRSLIHMSSQLVTDLVRCSKVTIGTLRFGSSLQSLHQNFLNKDNSKDPNIQELP